MGEAGPGPRYRDPGSGGPENDVTNRNTSFMAWKMVHLARMLKDAGGMPSTATNAPSGTPAATRAHRTASTAEELGAGSAAGVTALGCRAADLTYPRRRASIGHDHHDRAPDLARRPRRHARLDEPARRARRPRLRRDPSASHRCGVRRPRRAVRRRPLPLHGRHGPASLRRRALPLLRP